MVATNSLVIILSVHLRELYFQQICGAIQIIGFRKGKHILKLDKIGFT